MEANLSGSSSTSRQNQKIDVGGRLIKGLLRRSLTSGADETQHPRQTKLMQVNLS
ncbi:hypothetical protein DY000_02054616 [Brassica cretica]|uniref:Uncharacterized protein n=1 Tax=Brassica cretica TaxID=69181 RepID=A0ABQ7AKV6_BRACR|nr:hypothetical protein DY000_02054616 [Brassica cretica]